MISFIIYLLLFGFGFMDTLSAAWEAMNMDCNIYERYNYQNFDECKVGKDIGYTTIMYFIAMNVLGFADLGSYFFIVFKLTNPLIVSNSNLALIIKDKISVVKVPPVPVFVVNKKLYYVRDKFRDVERNNQLMIYVEDSAEPLFTERKERISMLLSVKDLKESAIKAKGIKQFNIFKLDHFKRHWLLVIDVDKRIYSFKPCKASDFDKSLPIFKFNIYKKMQIVLLKSVQQETEVHTSSANYEVINTNQVLVELKHTLSLGNNSTFNYSTLKMLKEIDNNVKYLFSINPKTLLVILGTVGVVGAIVMLYVLSGGAK